MTDSDGPKVDIPEELVAELEDSEAKNAEGDPPPAAADGDPPPAAADGDPPPAAADGEPGAQDELGALNDKYLRLAAEFDNFRRRTLKERQDLLNYATENLIKELLPTVDNLERALQASEQKEASDGENLSEGVELTYRSLLQALEKSGVSVVEAEGCMFDPKLHEALRQVASEDHEPGTILEIFQKGYLLKDRLLRPALVAVAGVAEEGSE